MPKRAERRWYEFSDELRAPADLPTPECYTDAEWGAYYEAEKEAIWNRKSIAKAMVKDMCGDCTLSYQKQQIREGKCKPQYGVITPLHRIALLMAGEEDPIEEEVESRFTPWAELPVLRGEGAGPSENGTGRQEAATDADDRILLSE